MNTQNQIEQLAELLNAMQQYTQALVAQQNNAVQCLHQVATDVKVQTQISMQQTSAHIAEQSHGVLQQALSSNINDFKQQLTETAGNLQRAANELTQERTKITTQAKFLMWKSMTIISALFLITVIASGVMVWSSFKQVEQNRQILATIQIKTDVRQAMQKVQLTSCGGQPCVKLDKDSPKWGKNGEFVLVQ